MPKILENGVHIYSASELKKIEKAASISSKVLKEAIDNAEEGITTLELNKLVESSIKKYKAYPVFKGYNNFPFGTCLSVNDRIVHGLADNRKLKNGDVISIDVGVRFDGFCGDNARTLIIGSTDIDLDVELVNIAEKACLEAMKQAIQGNTTGDIGYTINRTILSSYKDNKIGNERNFKVYESVFGHGIGAELHEYPNIPNIGSKGYGVPLMEGMCICIEPVILYKSSDPLIIMNSDYLVQEFISSDGKSSSHFENQVIITSCEPILLTTL